MKVSLNTSKLGHLTDNENPGDQLSLVHGYGRKAKPMSIHKQQ